MNWLDNLLLNLFKKYALYRVKSLFKSREGNTMKVSLKIGQITLKDNSSKPSNTLFTATKPGETPAPNVSAIDMTIGESEFSVEFEGDEYKHMLDNKADAIIKVGQATKYLLEKYEPELKGIAAAAIEKSKSKSASITKLEEEMTNLKEKIEHVRNMAREAASVQ